MVAAHVQLVAAWGLGANVLGVLQQVPVDAALAPPLGGLGDLAAHEQQLPAGWPGEAVALLSARRCPPSRMIAMSTASGRQPRITTQNGISKPNRTNRREVCRAFQQMD
jgi:hypothetical protein